MHADDILLYNQQKWNNLTTDETFIGSAGLSTAGHWLFGLAFTLSPGSQTRVLEPDHECRKCLFQTGLLYSYHVSYMTIMQEW